VGALAAARSDLSRFSTVTTQPRTVVGQHVAPLLSPVSVAYRADPAARSAAVAAAVAATGSITGSVSVVPGSAVNLISTAGDLPVTVRNSLDQPVTVRVVLHSSDPKLVVKNEPSVTVAAKDEATTRVAVRTLGNGTVSVYVELASPTGSTVSTAPPFDVRVHADWETVGTAVIVALLGVGLVAGIWRTVRRGRSSARSTRAQAPEAEVAGTPEAPPTGTTPKAPPPDAGPGDEPGPRPSPPRTGGALSAARPVPEPEELPSDPATPAGRTPGA
jgi:hypothetical protein